MSIQDAEWIGPFDLEDLPHWRCPRCKKGLLRRIKTKIIREHTSTSLKNSSSPDWEPTWSEERYSFLLRCSTKKCAESVLGLGKLTLEESYDEDDHSQRYVEKLKPIFLYPPPAIFKTPKNCPPDFRRNLQATFGLFWCCPNAAGNKIRNCVDLLLDYKRVNKTDGTGTKGKKLTLHKRLFLLKNKDKWLRESLLAIKWLGNVGSHDHGLSQKDLLNGLKIFELVVEEVFEKRTEKIESLTRRINRRRGRM